MTIDKNNRVFNPLNPFSKKPDKFLSANKDKTRTQVKGKVIDANKVVPKEKKKSKETTQLNNNGVDISSFRAFNPVEDLPESFYINIVASRRSGKGVMTEWILNLFQKSNRRFDVIFLISPTGDKNFMGIPPTYKYEDLDILDYIMAKQREIKEYNATIKDEYLENAIQSRVCVVIDDMAFSGNLHNSKIMNELAMNGRHISNPIDREGNCLSVIVLSQQLNKISPAQRRNNDFLFFNSVSSSLEAEMIMSECFFVIDTTRGGKQLAREIYHELATSKDFRFIAVGNCIQNKRRLEDYIFVVDAKLQKPFKYFGGRGEWESDTYFPKKEKIGKMKKAGILGLKFK